MRRRDIRAQRKDKRAPFAQQPRDNDHQQRMDAAFEQLAREREMAQQQGSSDEHA